MSFAFPASTAEFQPEIVPDSVAKRNNAGLLGEISNAGVPLKTCPVGDGAEVAVAGGGMFTTRGASMGKGRPEPSYRVLVPVRLFAIQNAPVEFKAMPQGLIRFGSVWSATPAMSETRLCCEYLVAGIVAGGLMELTSRLEV